MEISISGWGKVVAVDEDVLYCKRGEAGDTLWGILSFKEVFMCESRMANAESGKYGFILF